MARVKYGGLVTEVNGSVGGSTFQRSLYGNTLRNKPFQLHKQTSVQMGIRYFMHQLHQQWRTLTAAQRTAWNQFISYSNATIRRDRAVLLTGHDLFIKYNMFRLISGMAIMTDPVYSPMPAFPTGPNFAIDPPDPDRFDFNVGDTVTHTALWFVLKMTNVRLASRSYSRQGLRFIFITPSTNTAWDIYDNYIAAFGARPATDDWIHASIQWFSVTSPVMVSPVVGAFQIQSY